MINFWAMLKLTITLAVRSHIFQLLLTLLLLCIFLLPNTISGDGTARGFIQISLKYNLAVIGFILTVSSVWLSCHTMNRDLDGHQLHLVFTKAIPRWKVWLGKCSGVFIVHLIMLIIAAVSVYSQILWQYNNNDYSEDEKTRLSNEVLVGRRTFYPKIINIGAIVKDENEKKLKSLQFKIGAQADMMAQSMTRSTNKKVIKDVSRVRYGPTESREWEISGLPVDGEAGISLRYRAYVDNLFSSTGKQRQTAGLWSARLTVPDGTDNNGKTTYKSFYRSVSNQPVPYIGGTFHELRLPNLIVDQQGHVQLKYINFDFSKKDQFFQPKDGPVLLIKVTDFFNNYSRSVVVLSTWLAFVTIMACSLSTFSSLFSALFMSGSYLVIGLLVTFISGSGNQGVTTILNFIFVNPEAFDVSSLVADGQLIEYSLIINYFIISTLFMKGIPFLLAGIWFYSRREIGLVIKK